MESFDEWDILDKYFKDNMYPFTKHHLDSYRQFIKTYIPETIKSYNPITMIKVNNDGEEFLKVEVYIGGQDMKGFYIDRPIIPDHQGDYKLLSPHEARLRNMSYTTRIYADIEIVYYQDGEMYDVKKFANTLIANIPLMLHSDQCMLYNQGSKVLREFGECPMDQGGYFIIDGKEKVIVSQERITTNRLFIGESTDENMALKAIIRCTPTKGEGSLIPKTVEFNLLKKVDVEFDKDIKEDYRPYAGAILVNLPSITGELPLTTLFRALGFESDKSIVEAIFGPFEDIHPSVLNFLRPSLMHGASTGIFTMKDAHETLKNRVHYKSIEYVKSIITTELFPNIDGTIREKGLFLGLLVNDIMKVALNINPMSDRDSYIFKRVDISGFLLAQLFQESYSKFRKAVRDTLDREYYYGPWKNTNQIELLVRKDNIYRIFSSDIISDIFMRSIKGMWGSVQDDPEQGKVQDLSRISYIGSMSHLRRVNMPIKRSLKLTSPHRLHSQQWGIMCPFESPDGGSIGYLKNFALMTHITSGTDPDKLVKVLDSLNVVALKNISLIMKDHVKVFINGTLYGITKKPQTLVRALRLYRRNGLINQFISVAWDIVQNLIRVQTEAGRPCRPLLIVKDSEALIYKKYKDIKKTNWFELMYGDLFSNYSSTKLYDDEFINPMKIKKFEKYDSIEEICDKLEDTQGVIEYLDIEEENTLLLAMKKEELHNLHTHLEIHPSTAFSVVTNIVPFANHNQAPRVYFHAAQSKQGLGVYVTNWNKRFDTMGYIQHYPQKRIITTRGSHYNGCDKMPNGFNAVVAIMIHTGFNQEDSIIINKNAIDRGLFQTTSYKTMVASEKTINQDERIMFADPIKLRDKLNYQVDNIKHAEYSLIKSDDSDDKNSSSVEGIIQEGSYIPRGQNAVVVGMVHEKRQRLEKKKGILVEHETVVSYRDVSEVTDVHHYGKIDKVFVGYQNSTSISKDRICKIRFRKIRRPELGDKGASSHGQKGVIGKILPEQDMPFTKDGIKPDLIINPHAIPSRMTIGHLVETVFSKLCCLEGCTGDGTVFLPFDFDKMYDDLEKHDFEKHGNEILYNGKNGQQIETEIFIGPIYYYRLKHMVTDKIHARDRGPKDGMTRQPKSGRSNQGGLRIGEMERDVLLAHGLSQFTKECMMEKSDKYRWKICRNCGVISGRNKCANCMQQNLVEIDSPYTFKLLVQEFEAMGIQIRLSPDSPPDENYEDDDIQSDEEEQQLRQVGGLPTWYSGAKQELEEKQEQQKEEDISESLSSGGDNEFKEILDINENTNHQREQQEEQTELEVEQEVKIVNITGLGQDNPINTGGELKEVELEEEDDDDDYEKDEDDDYDKDDKDDEDESEKDYDDYNQDNSKEKEEETKIVDIADIDSEFFNND